MTADELIAKKLAALAHPTRIAIIRKLMRAGLAGLPAGKLGEAINIGASALTFHLQKLENNDLVTSRRKGQFMVYSIVFSNLLELADNLAGACCADTSEKCSSECPSTEFGPGDIDSMGNTVSDDLSTRKKEEQYV